MKSLLALALILAPISWATPISISGSAYTNIGLHLNGPGGFEFDSTGGSGAWHPYADCVSGRGCDLSGGAAATSVLDGSFFASDGSRSVGVNGGPAGTPPGTGAFHITWIATPFSLDTLPGVPPANHIDLTVPVIVFGTVQAWTEQELASNSIPFFNYSFRGSGTLSVSANLVYTGPPLSISAFFNGANTAFTGAAEPVPEPASWWLVMTALAAGLLRQSCRRA